MIGLTIFDVDRTLTIRPTYSHFLLFAALRLSPWRLTLLPALVAPGVAYARKKLPRRQMKEAMHRVALGARVERGRVEHVANAFGTRLATHGVYPQALDIIKSERADGRRLLLATAAPSLYVSALASRLGIYDSIATGCTWRDGALCPEIEGDNCYGDAKLEMIEAWLAHNDIARASAHIRFLSDHESDLPTFEWADEAIAVNPSRRLRAVAEARGWFVLDWRRERSR